jgi:hypothetical protein
MKIANLSATTTEATQAEARVTPFTQILKTANLISVTGNAASSTSAYSTLSIYKRTANGSGAAVLMASANLSGVVVTQWVPVPLTLVANGANTSLALGDVVTANIVLTSTGVANNLACELDFVTEDV